MIKVEYCYDFDYCETEYEEFDNWKQAIRFIEQVLFNGDQFRTYFKGN